MRTEQITKIIAAVEPDAWMDETHPRDIAIVSQAISAKRQADALVKIAHAIVGDETNAGLAMHIGNVLENAIMTWVHNR